MSINKIWEVINEKAARAKTAKAKTAKTKRRQKRQAQLTSRVLVAGIDFEVPDEYNHIPTPEHANKGYFVLIEPKMFPDGIVRRKVMVTDKGVRFLAKEYGKEKEAEAYLAMSEEDKKSFAAIPDNGLVY